MGKLEDNKKRKKMRLLILHLHYLSRTELMIPP